MILPATNVRVHACTCMYMCVHAHRELRVHKTTPEMRATLLILVTHTCTYLHEHVHVHVGANDRTGDTILYCYGTTVASKSV